MEEFKLRVIYFPANPPSPVPEGSDEGSSPRAVVENGNQNSSLFDAVSFFLHAIWKVCQIASVIHFNFTCKTSGVKIS